MICRTAFLANLSTGLGQEPLEEIMCDRCSELLGSLKFRNVSIFFQLIQRGPKISCTKTQTFTLRISSGDV